MGNKIRNRIVVINIMLILAIVCLKLSPVSKPVVKKHTLNQVLTDIQSWNREKGIEIDSTIVEALSLDDYVNNVYSKNGQNVTLYIGYYTSNLKTGKAHHPLVCFTGQGWILGEIKKSKLETIDKESIRYASFIANQGYSKQLIIYWFQSYNQTSADSLNQKIKTLFNKIIYGAEDSALVRVSMPIDDESSELSIKILIDFINAFYPKFLDFVYEGNKKIIEQ